MLPYPRTDQIYPRRTADESVDINVYLPDELGQWAKESGMNLSQALRREVEAERQRRQAREETRSRSAKYELRVEGPDSYGGTGRFTARLHGTMIAEHPRTPSASVQVFLGQDEKVYVFDGVSGELHRDVDPAELADEHGLSEAEYIKAMRALGEEVVIDIGLPY